jgi:hypothetical protein
MFPLQRIRYAWRKVLWEARSMLIRRLVNAIREQNWFSVVLEVAVVVVGIFIGLQVDDWNQRRIEQESDQRALALFVDELQLMAEEATFDKDFVNEYLEAILRGTEIALNCEASEADRAALVTAIGNTLNWRVPDIRPSGLAEIGNSGTLARIGNAELVRAVGEINQFIKMFDDSMDLIGPQYTQAWEMLSPYLLIQHPIRIEKRPEGVERQPAAEYMSLLPQDALCTSQEFLVGLSLLANFYESSVWTFDTWHASQAKARNLALAELE